MQAHWLDTQGPIGVEELQAEGVHYDHLSTDPTAYQAPLDALKEARGYIEQDVVELSPETPNLEAICAKFVDEHAHAEDEVRFVLSGEGIFDIRSRDDRWMRVQVGPGDVIVVPMGRYHRFMLTEGKQIRCVRLFKDSAGWVPEYRSQ
jgi:1,2-dihydroxy-3-keto-5-methylthiopentene dioxygenase